MDPEEERDQEAEDHAANADPNLEHGDCDPLGLWDPWGVEDEGEENEEECAQADAYCWVCGVEGHRAGEGCARKARMW